MKRLLLAATAAVVAFAPIAASAQGYNPNREVREDRRELREERRDLRQTQRQAARDGYISPREAREINRDRRDVNRAQRDLRYSRTDRRTWQGRPEWRGFNGARAGYFFAPGYGYRPIDRRWANTAWRRGQYVPPAYRTLYVQDPYYYGLRPAPAGYRWVYLNNNFALMALGTGLIADLIMNGY
jgi:Ni/Co efflux regulator RcnB